MFSQCRYRYAYTVVYFIWNNTQRQCVPRIHTTYTSQIQYLCITMRQLPVVVTVISSYTLSPHIDSQCEVGCHIAVTVNTGSLSCATVLPTKAISRAKQDSKSRSSNALMQFYGIESVLAEIRNELGSLTCPRNLLTANVVKTPQSVVLIRLDSGAACKRDDAHVSNRDLSETKHMSLQRATADELARSICSLVCKSHILELLNARISSRRSRWHVKS